LCRRKDFILSVDETQHTALHRAANSGRTDVVEYLCSLSLADNELILKQNASGRTALHDAKNREIAKLLIESVLPENQKTFILCADENQCTALHTAAKAGSTDLVEYLCSLSLPDDELILKKNAHGRTALHTAAITEKTRVVECLCSLAELSVPLIFRQDCFNNTAMHHATNKTIVSCMLSSLEDAQIDELLSLTNYVGNTPILSLVELGQHESLAELLQHIENETDLDTITYLEQHNYY